LQQQCKLSKERKKDSFMHSIQSLLLLSTDTTTTQPPNHPSLLQNKSAQPQTKGHVFLCTHNPETKKTKKNKNKKPQCQLYKGPFLFEKN
jgi:hypothetical protein